MVVCVRNYTSKNTCGYAKKNHATNVDLVVLHVHNGLMPQLIKITKNSSQAVSHNICSNKQA